MNVCVYGAANDSIDSRYLAEGTRLGQMLASAGHALVFGAGDTGMMGAVARGCKEGGAPICGVAPQFFDKPGVLYQACDEMLFTQTMRQRKQLMEDRSDAFVMCPGGLGTMEEFFEIITLKQLGRHEKPIIILNLLGYYDPLICLIEHAIRDGFARDIDDQLFLVANSAEEVIEYLK